MTNRSFGPLFGTSRESADLVSIAVNAVRNGFAVLPVHPGKKSPMCTLNTIERNRADKAASQRAKEAGHKGWMNVRHSNNGECGVKHAITDEKEASRVFKRLIGKHPELNIALEVGGSRMICVDADNARDVDEYTALWAAECDLEALRYVLPTVSSPGKQKESGEWTHKGGGHFWYYLPDDYELPDTTAGPLKLGGSVVYFKDRVLLVPPSVRDEGPYVYQSDVGIAPQFLLEMLTLHIEGTAERRKIQRAKIRQEGDPIDVWSADTPWSELLVPDGWTQAHKFDSCQCEVWTRPGEDWSSPKSATAHEPGCTQWDTSDSGHGFLHIWTDEPPDFLRTMIDATGSRSLSKLQYVAWRDHEGDMAAAMRDIGLASNVEQVDPWKLIGVDAPTPQQIEQAVTASDPKDEGARETSLISALLGMPLPAPSTAATSNAPLSADGTTPETHTGTEGASATPHDGPDEEDEEGYELRSWNPASVEAMAAILDGTVEQVRGTLLPRSDGVCLLYAGRVHWVQGEPESGKSWLMQLAVAMALEAGKNALYVDYEQDLGTIVTRLSLLGVRRADLLSGRLKYISPEVSHLKAWDKWVSVLEGEYDIAVVDGVTDALGLSAVDMNKNSEVAAWMRGVPRAIARYTGAAVVCVDHVIKDKEGRGRYALGAQAKLAGVDGASYIVEPVEMMAPGKKGVLEMRVLKDRYGAIRAASGEWRKADRSQLTATITLDSDGTKIDALIEPPTEEESTVFTPTEVMERVSVFLETLGEPATMTQLDKEVSGKRAVIQAAVTILEKRGYVVREQVVRRGQSTVAYRFLKGFKKDAA